MAARIRHGLAAVMATGLLMALPPFGSAQTPLRPDAGLEPLEFTLEDVPYRISLPKGARPSRVNAPGCLKIWHPRSKRPMKFLELCSTSGSVPTAFPRLQTLSNGARVGFTINHDIGGGSGGTEGELKGRLDLNGKVFALTCRDQGEWENDPGWCLDYLRYLKVEERK